MTATAISTPLQLINKLNKLYKLPQVTTSAFMDNSFSSAQLEGLNFIMRDLDKRDPLWAVRNASYTLTTSATQSTNEAGFDLDSSSYANTRIKPGRIRRIYHGTERYKLEKIDEDDFRKYVNYRRNTDQVTVEGGNASKWFIYNGLLYLVDSVPNSAQTYVIEYQASMSTPLTTSDLTSTTALIYPVEDENVLIRGVGWMTRIIQMQDESHSKVLAAKQEYELEILKSTIDEDNNDKEIQIDQSWADVFMSGNVELDD